MLTNGQKIINQIVSVLLFSFLTLSLFAYFMYTFSDFILQMISKSNKIILNKGAIYLFGAGITSLSLSIYMVYETWTQKPTPNALAKPVTKLAIFGLITCVIFPQLIHYPVNFYLKNQNYDICLSESYQWFNAHVITYTNNDSLCKE